MTGSLTLLLLALCLLAATNGRRWFFCEGDGVCTKCLDSGPRKNCPTSLSPEDLHKSKEKCKQKCKADSTNCGANSKDGAAMRRELNRWFKDIKKQAKEAAFADKADKKLARKRLRKAKTALNFVRNSLRGQFKSTTCYAQLKTKPVRKFIQDAAGVLSGKSRVDAVWQAVQSQLLDPFFDSCDQVLAGKCDGMREMTCIALEIGSCSSGSTTTTAATTTGAGAPLLNAVDCIVDDGKWNMCASAIPRCGNHSKIDPVSITKTTTMYGAVCRNWADVFAERGYGSPSSNLGKLFGNDNPSMVYSNQCTLNNDIIPWCVVEDSISNTDTDYVQDYVYTDTLQDTSLNHYILAYCYKYKSCIQPRPNGPPNIFDV